MTEKAPEKAAPVLSEKEIAYWRDVGLYHSQAASAAKEGMAKEPEGSKTDQPKPTIVQILESREKMKRPDMTPKESAIREVLRDPYTHVPPLDVSILNRGEIQIKW